MTSVPTATHSRAKEPYLKGLNAAYLWTFVAINLAVFFCLVVSNGLTEASLDHFWQKATTKSGIFAAGIPILAIVLGGLLSDTAKARLVFWRWTNPLPGCRVFTFLIHSDPRIDIQALAAKLGNFPTVPQEQNSLWFNVYRRHKAALRVLEAHRLYLLTRDMTAIAFAFFFLLSTIGLLQLDVTKVAGLYALALLVQFLLVASASRHYGDRFVLNVLVEELHPNS